MGNYVNNNLLRDEQVIYETTYHWMIFISFRGLLSLFILPALDRWSDEFVITNKRIVIKTGLLSRRTLEMNLNKVETVNVDQSIFGRLLGYGNVTVIGTGGTRETFSNLSNPIAFRRNFQENTA